MLVPNLVLRPPNSQNASQHPEASEESKLSQALVGQCVKPLTSEILIAQYQYYPHCELMQYIMSYFSSSQPYRMYKEHSNLGENSVKARSAKPLD